MEDRVDVPAPRYFSRHASLSVTGGNLPHWEQEGVATFATFRLRDSIPQEKVRALAQEMAEWEQAHPRPWDEAVEREHAALFLGRQEKWLDAGYGSCVLARPEVREIVEGAVRHFSGVRYVLYAYVVMPNHVHVLFMPLAGHVASDILKSWKGFTARQANLVLGTQGAFWQRESWDRLIRDVAHFKRAMNYIHGNDPRKAFSVWPVGI